VADGIDAAMKGYESPVAHPAFDSIAAHPELDELGMADHAMLERGEAGDNPVETGVWPVLRAVYALETGHTRSVARRALQQGCPRDVFGPRGPKRHC
jgi:hypothetical protein